MRTIHFDSLYRTSGICLLGMMACSAGEKGVITYNVPPDVVITEPVTDSYYEHDDWDLRTENMQEDENVNGRSHVRGSIIGSTSVSLPIVDAEIILGRWQRLFFVELDCGRSRRLFVQIQDLN